MNNLAYFYRKVGDLKNALNLFEELFILSKDNDISMHIDKIDVMHHLSQLLFSLEKYKESLKVLYELYDVLKQNNCDENTLKIILANIGSVTTQILNNQ
jgi:tetratricopeptide (TPR) repeat protein